MRWKINKIQTLLLMIIILLFFCVVKGVEFSVYFETGSYYSGVLIGFVSLYFGMVAYDVGDYLAKILNK